MIRITYTGVRWGIDPIDDGIQINLLDEKSEIMSHIPFTGESLVGLISQMAEHMSDEQKKAVAPVFAGGIILPDRDFNPEDIINPPDPKAGPQG